MKIRRIGLINLVCLIGLLGLIYLISLIIYTKNRSIKNTLTSIQKGSLVLNTDKSHYTPGEEVYIQITSLDKNGKTICDSNLELSIFNTQMPNTKYQIPISISPTCSSSENISTLPDYTAFFIPKEEGTYKITLKNKDDGNLIEKQITASLTNPDISIKRWSPTKINLAKEQRYPMIITVKSGKGFKGTIIDSIPKEFDFIWYGTAQINSNNSKNIPIKDRKLISWEIDLKPNEEKELKYEYTISGNQKIYTIGPIYLNNEEISGSTWKVLSRI